MHIHVKKSFVCKHQHEAKDVQSIIIISNLSTIYAKAQCFEHFRFVWTPFRIEQSFNNTREVTSSFFELKTVELNLRVFLTNYTAGYNIL